MADSIDDLFQCFEEDSDTEKASFKNESTEIQPSSDSKTQASKREHDDDAAVESFSKKAKTEEEVDLQDINLEELKNRIVVHVIESMESCTHEVACPPGQEYTPLKTCRGEPAKTYPFVLDSFQKESILCVDNNQSVLVSAHTSAGKTVIAEYAIALSLKNKQRVIYTTPIKALSNQKYREFLDEFKDVGLITGDVTINPSASCLIMTTEILRNMLYRGSEVMREVGWVVFDEIHYMRDKERGVVWEETLILLPHNVHFVFLSATIPNARQFAEWVAHLHDQPCHVVYTDYRPTPLQHFIYPAGGSGIHMVVDETGTFKDDSYNAAMAVLQNSGDAAKGDEKGRRGGIKNKDATQTDIFKVIKMIMERNFAPVIVFSFSKKDCEVFAMQMTKLDFNTTAEKHLVDEVFNNAMDVLSDDDRHLPQVENLLPLLRRGIGIHHGGLLPILKETIEILFGEGLIKALFATETFAMGLNMPARTVLFTGMRKFDGHEYRWITSGEYIQMSGRAGRRGLDDKGIVILMVDEKVPPAAGRNIVKGLPDPINSAFHLTYNMVLNLLRVEEINPEYMLERSFYQFQNQTAIPGLYDKYKEKLEEFNNLQIESEPQIASYHTIRQELDKLGLQFRSYLTKPNYLIPFLQPGRLVKIKVGETEYDWGAVVNFKKVSENIPGRKHGKANPAKTSTKVQVDLLLHVMSSEDGSNNKDVIPKPCLDGQQKGEVEIVSVESTLITHISTVRLYCPNDLRQKDTRKGVYKSIKEVKKRFPEGPPLLNPIDDMKITESDFVDIVKKIEQLEKKMYDHPLHKHSLLNTEYEKYEQKVKCKEELAVARQKLLEAKSVLQLDELKCRKRVLRRLGYCTNTDVIQLKGRVACELSSADELLITEMIFNGVFGNLSPAQACALLSTFVCDEKSNEMPKLSEELSGPLRQMQDLARRIAKVSTEARLPLDEDAYVERFKPGLMDVVFSWCNGSSFSDLCKMTEIFEGSIVRCMRRLEELLRQMIQASKTIGNTDLEDKFNTAIKVIKRDIIFSSSLYL
ncbi:exosome RNA helicase MTR4 isoform X1 [Tribolium castaneum]|uniref:RNA helicase n=1 Tax=Tribolium castaneum TaxID=7070 RepID=D6WE72_TRICA|nr:PREDICTED: superkiller viralicidic activity 2-like 2 isoform X1 [Tribolium castaneum]EFA01232.2 Superkiller viralicidic activity 2-like 2 [Tribolium castaneum]|eukprot:XP_008199267.1 PREDICTED: superkiller viralicidic activity 2-like 2 isoform X1 [Tribolium castaneum]